MNDRNSYFGDQTIESVMLKNAHLKHRAFIDVLVSEAIAWHGTDMFEDDICIICIDA